MDDDENSERPTLYVLAIDWLKFNAIISGLQATIEVVQPDTVTAAYTFIAAGFEQLIKVALEDLPVEARAAFVNHVTDEAYKHANSTVRDIVDRITEAERLAEQNRNESNNRPVESYPDDPTTEETPKPGPDWN